MKLASAASIASVVTATKSDHWAVLVAGSMGYHNYRHQADVCHAYQILKKNGVPEDQIIVMSMDDVASDPANPFKGQLFNKPTKDGVKGVDVYDGCKIDYKNDDVTATNLLNVLQGYGIAAGGPALKTDQNSKIFFYYADHGAPGLLAMPYGEFLYANKLHSTFNFMHENMMYKEMVVYIEACESGSMFDGILESDKNIYAVTAANGSESSWAAYCSPDDKVNGKSIGSCLGDLFSVNWMEDSEKSQMGSETLEEQFKVVQQLTTKSHAQQFGQLSIDSESLANFQSGFDAVQKQDWWNVLKTKGFKALDDWKEENLDQSKSAFAVDSRDVKLHYLYNKVMQDASPENHQALQDELNHRMWVDQTMEKLFGHHFEAMKNGTTPNPKTEEDFNCYRELIRQYEEQCQMLDDYSLKYLKTFAAECASIKVYPAALDETLLRFDKVCPITA